MQADLLDIIFENRNKNYGAYALRRGYNNRLLVAIGAGMSVILLFVLISKMKADNNSSASMTPKEEMYIRQVELPKEKLKEPEPPKEVVKAKTAAPKIAQVKFTTPPKIAAVVKDPLPPVEDLAGKQTATVTTVGKPDDGLVKSIPQVPVDVQGGSTSGPSQPKENDFVIQERDPEFPGGHEALKKFLGKYLSTPSALEAGEKKVVRIRFKVDKDGSVNSFEVVASAGGDYDNEVVRVCKKMPKWIPAIQNGVNVPVSYILPVTFIGVEE
jgi:periplasmic protein TonB